MRLAGTKLAANHQYRGFGDQLYDLSGQRPSLDLNFSSSKSLIDSASGQNLVTFTRASSGTYVGSDGLIKTATTNLTTFSEQINDASWTKNASSVTSDAAIAPNGTTTADKIVEDTTTASHGVVKYPTIASNSVVVASAYVKKAERQYIRISTGDAFGGNSVVARINLDTGIINSVLTSGTNPPTNVFSGILAVGNGWYRIWVGGTMTGGSTNGAININATNSSYLGYAGDGSSGFFLWGAQLEQSSTVGESIPTTSTINSAPRFDHNPTTGESLGLLVEEQRTNLVLRSEDFSTTWSAGASVAITSNDKIAPDGKLTADKIVQNGADTAITQTVNTGGNIASKSFALSLYVYAGTSFNFTLRLRGTGTTTEAADYTVLTVANQWTRVNAIINFTAAADGTNILVALYPDLRGVTGSNTIWFWGAQLDAGAFPTSYIPTTTATVTRSADVASISGSNFSSWYRQDEGTVLVDVPGIYNTASAFTFSDGTNNNRILLDHGTNTRRSRIVTGGADQVSLTSSYVYGSPIKSTVAYALDNSALASNGSLSANSPDTSCVMPTVIDRLNIGSNAASATQAGTSIRRLTYWPQRLPNETLQAVTQ